MTSKAQRSQRRNLPQADASRQRRSVPRRRGIVEVGALARLGAPMAATQFFIMGMGFLDTAMAGHYASVDLAGVALGSYVLWPVFMLLSGCTMSVTPIVAQLVGGGRTGEAGGVVRQGLIVGAAASAVAVALVVGGSLLLPLANVDPAAADIAGRYLRAAALGLPASLCYIVLRHSSEGLGRTVPPMAVAGLALALNAVLNYAFIYGELGAPELGGEGCGWATAGVLWFELAAMTAVSRAGYFRRAGLWRRGARWKPDFALIARILFIGAPIGVSVFVGMALFAIVGFLIGNLGVVPLAAHSIAGHINWATYVIPMSLGSAASVRIGFHVGAGDYGGAARVARVAVLLSLSYAVAVSLLLVLARHELVRVYSDDAAVTGLAATLLLFVALYQIFDDTQATMAGSLRGYKDTRWPMIYSLAGYWALALPLGVVLGFGWWGLPALGVHGFWLGLTAGLAAVATAMAARLLATSRDTRRIALLAR